MHRPREALHGPGRDAGGEPDRPGRDAGGEPDRPVRVARPDDPPLVPFTTAHRTRCLEEILVTFVGDPTHTLPDVARSTVFRSDVRRLRVDPTSLWVARDDLTWAATLRTHRWWRRRAMLRVFGSPSRNVTVLTLTPTRPHRLATRAFVREGRRAMVELRDRFDHAAAGGRSPTPPAQRPA